MDALDAQLLSRDAHRPWLTPERGRPLKGERARVFRDRSGPGRQRHEDRAKPAFAGRLPSGRTEIGGA
jgi:hypothetical protein